MANLKANIQTQFKKKLGDVSQKVMQAEKLAETQIGEVVKKVEGIRKEQTARVRELMAEARKLKSKELVQHVEAAKKQIEEKAATSFASLLKKLNLPTNKELDKLNRKISALEKRLKDLDHELFGK